MSDPKILASKCYRFCLWKAYFEKGEGLTRYAKYIIGFFGLATMDIGSTLAISIGYILFCLVFGRWWFLRGLSMMEHEVSNNFNLFVREMREEYKKKP